MTYQQMYWRPISTAPTEDCKILAYVHFHLGPEVVIVEGPTESGAWIYTELDWMDVHPTHWMPLPDIPEGEHT